MCAGLIAAGKDNHNCGVGVAYDCKYGAVRLLSGNPNTDAKEAAALTALHTEVDIYSNSWGPSDQGDVLDGPQELAREAIKTGG